MNIDNVLRETVLSTKDRLILWVEQDAVTRESHEGSMTLGEYVAMYNDALILRKRLEAFLTEAEATIKQHTPQLIEEV